MGGAGPGSAATRGAAEEVRHPNAHLFNAFQTQCRHPPTRRRPSGDVSESTTPAVAVADPALLGGVQDFLLFFLPSTRGANGGGEQDVSAARGEEETAASARMRHASCRTGSGRAAARMARRGRRRCRTDSQPGRAATAAEVVSWARWWGSARRREEAASRWEAAIGAVEGDFLELKTQNTRLLL